MFQLQNKFMQHILIKLESENGKHIDEVDVNFADILKTVNNTGQYVNYQWITTVDPYGLTVLNNLQFQKLKDELEHLKKNNPNDSLLNTVIDKVIQINERLKLQPDILVKFIGD